jgi:FkbM family methyltransferase
VIRRLARRVLPVNVRSAILNAPATFQERLAQRELAILESRMCSASGSGPGEERLHNYIVRFNDGPAAFGQFRLIFKDLIYQFKAEREDPLILDCGSNIGLSILYFKNLYPKARIVGFEPDPAMFPYLQQNIEINKLFGIHLVQAALSSGPGKLTFYSDGQSGSCLEQNLPQNLPADWVRCEVPSVCLRDYITGRVDFLKMNIEGAEWEALADCDERLRLVEQMVIEYHHWEGLPRTLHKILGLLHRHGFDYLINHFDYEVNPALRPPFHLARDTRYYLMIFAKRMDCANLS